jgi:D-glycero-alpha-D-manno-heptose-7-phosphate kinase
MNNQGDEKKGLLNNMYNMVQEGFDILYNSKTKEEMIYEFGKLLHKAWIMKKSLSVHVSNEKIDQLYEKGIQAGALGGKLCGAGSGGFVLFIVPEDKRDNVIQSLKQYKKIDIRFHHFGSRVIYSSIVG